MRLDVLAFAALLALAGCSVKNTDIADESPPPQTNDDSDIAEPPAPEPDIVEEPAPPPIKTSTGPLSAKDIMAALANKTFRYSKGPSSGTVSYFSDGTFTYQEKGKGEGTGVWQASDGKLCEALDPASFLPKGTRSECQAFNAANGSYQSGGKRLSPV